MTHWLRHLQAALAAMLLRMSPPGPPRAAPPEFSSAPGGKGLRMAERLRDALRRRWLRIR